MVVARCWQQWITEGRVYRPISEGQDVPGTQMIARDRAIRRVATSAPTTSLASIQRHSSFQTSSAIKRNHKKCETTLTEVGLRSRRPLRRLPLTHIIGSVDWDFADLGNLRRV
ncbi:hypothetical protein TNCV_4699681 [Trichonephila clavipes]|nr:hypothetical protein TNCV_4699681 [Trichonephila clavipes]